MENKGARQQLERLQISLQNPDINLMDIARRSTIGYNTLRNIRDGKANPTVSMIEKVQDAIDNCRKI